MPMPTHSSTTVSASAPLKRLAYGEQSYEHLREGGFAFVDKTPYLRMLEDYESPFLFILRPPQFGKTLLTSMLAAYYDRAAQDRFEQNFAGTWALEHRTPLAGQYLVLRFSFAGACPRADGKDFVRHLLSSMQLGLIDFTQRYLKGAPETAQQADALTAFDSPFDSPAALLSALLDLVARRFGRRKELFVIIDDFDHVADPAGSLRDDIPPEVKQGQRLLADFYRRLKAATEDQVARVLITGRTTVWGDARSEGFDIAKDVTRNASFLGLMGFTGRELLRLVEETIDTERLGCTARDVARRMMALYGGYRFCQHSDTEVAIPAACIHYLQTLARTGREPEYFLSSTGSYAMRVIDRIFDSSGPSTAEHLVSEIIAGSPLDPGLLSLPMNADREQALDPGFAIDALFFRGCLSFAPRTELCACPNAALQRLFLWRWFRSEARLPNFWISPEEGEAAAQALETGNPGPLFEAVALGLGRASADPGFQAMDAVTLQHAAAFALCTSRMFVPVPKDSFHGRFFTALVLKYRTSPPAPLWLIGFRCQEPWMADAKETKEDTLAKDLDYAQRQIEYFVPTREENPGAFLGLRRAFAVFSGARLLARKTR